ncbi:MAG: type I-E CRISPR-associated protein Cse1/CasA, partial [Rhodospirillaceae bacterium]
MHDFLTEPLIPIRSMDGDAGAVSLPGLLARLSGDGVAEFPGLAAHQRQPWYQFLVQLAAIALDRSGGTEPPVDAAAWGRLLAALTPVAHDCAWSLVVEEPDRPALLQPPAPERNLDGYGQAADTPDAIDILVTAKNHDVKMARMGAAQPHHWFYALVTLQTLQGFLGAGNYGIARMNGGFASRVMIDTVPALDWGARFCSGLRLLLDQRSKGSELPFRHDDGKALLWLEPWNGEDSLALDDLDPHFIEICRRVRLVRRNGSGPIVAWGRTSRAARVQGKDYKGAVGDPWIPVDKKAAALTIGANGFNYRKLADILYSPEYEPPASLLPRVDANWLHCQVLVRGQGKTDGLFDRVLPFPKRQQAAFTSRDNPARAAVHKLADSMVGDASNAKKALKRGLLVLLNRGFPADPAKRLKLDDNRADRWIDKLDQRIDQMFFDHLWALAAIEPGDDDGFDAAWRTWHEALKQATQP